MRSKANTSSDSSPPEHPCRADIGKLILEGMMTVFIVLMFLFIAQNWVLTNVGATLFTPTCTDGLLLDIFLLDKPDILWHTI